MEKSNKTNINIKCGKCGKPISGDVYESRALSCVRIAIWMK